MAEEAIESLDIAVPDAGKAVFGMSGGNQQKAVMAKWLLADTDVILFDEPTRGIDVGSKMEIYQQMDRMAAEGKTILMISSELPELLGMCDRICVMREGRLVKEFSVEEFKAEDIGEFMLESPAQSADADVCGDQGGSL